MNPPSLLLILIFSLIINLTKAQTKKETIEDCRNAYLIGNDNSIILTKPSFTEFRKCIIGKPFPSFSEIAISGKNYSSIDLQNKVVFINFWFTHCSPCLAELAILNEINKEYKGEDFLFLSFSTDTVKELKRFMGSHKIDYDVFPDARELITEFKTTYAYPTNIILDKKGMIVELRVDVPTNKEGLDKAKIEFIDIIKRELDNYKAITEELK